MLAYCDTAIVESQEKVVIEELRSQMGDVGRHIQLYSTKICFYEKHILYTKLFPDIVAVKVIVIGKLALGVVQKEFSKI